MCCPLEDNKYTLVCYYKCNLVLEACIGYKLTMISMHPPSVFSFFLILILVIFHQLKCDGRDSINVKNPLSESGETPVTSGNRFELGFFTPEDGNIKLWCSSGFSVAITSLESADTSNRTLELLDSGNLILVDGQSGARLWQSFDNPTDTFLPGMIMNDDLKLTSWKSSSDPGTGNYMFRQDQGGFSIQKGSTFYWKSGKTGTTTINDKLPLSVSQLLLDSATEVDQRSKNFVKGNRSISYSNYTKNSGYNDSRLVMSSSGKIQYFYKSVELSLLWSEPENPCSVYDVCGNFAVCNSEKEPMCQCPQGFKPASLQDWAAKQYSEGCDRESTICSNKDSFLNFSLIEVRGEVILFNRAGTEEACRDECLSNCQCKAYSYIEDDDGRRRGTDKSAPKCWIWTNEIVNLHQGENGGRLKLSLSVPPPLVAVGNPGEDAVAPEARKRYVIAVTFSVVGVILVAFLSYILYRRRKARRSGNQGSDRATLAVFSNENERRVNNLMQENDMRIDVPFYNVDIILSATDNFSEANKLGQGGFGPVYKGKFPGGEEFAVKRLSSLSGQGVEEFLNEVVLIAKLQHRNLVRLLGYCIKENEKILYEYMPNRSLDAFIFDPHNSLVLDWKKRFDIILGVARGLLYLHQDSRLRIFHRDLKTSNILLDEDMNPKISDFGLARIVEGKGTEASTNKVVGTYGYMSPEYALDGKFSTKSDVFSFGIVVLEIISGKKTTGSYDPHEVLNLLGYTWRLWSDDKALDLVDPTLLESCEKSQVMKCINIGLLCVQEDPNERPSMSTAVIMLGSETGPLPVPTQPAFVVRRRVTTASSSSSSSTKSEMISKNELTVSMVQGR